MISEDAIRNEQGQVAIKWLLERRNPSTVKIDGTNRYYTFSPQNHVALDWVQPQDVEKILEFKLKPCNCGNVQPRQAYGYASQLDVNIFLYNNRHGKES